MSPPMPWIRRRPSVTGTTPPSGATERQSGDCRHRDLQRSDGFVHDHRSHLRTAGCGQQPGCVHRDRQRYDRDPDADQSLAAATTYTATVKGGQTDPRVKDLSGNALAASATWSFTTASQPCTGTPCTAWSSTTVPAIPSANDPSAVELGVKFRSDLAGYITGIRFYKGTGNTGTHVGNLWSVGGTKLATATFTNETGTGWQQVAFPTPVPIAANTVYVASYHAPNGGYAADGGYFANSGVDNPPFICCRMELAAATGVYAYGPGGFPTQTWNSTNYWVDVVLDHECGSRHHGADDNRDVASSRRDGGQPGKSGDGDV